MTVKDFGITKDGIATKLYTLKNNNLEISVTDFWFNSCKHCGS